ncbi:phosphoribosyltransferase family protein [Micromonospora sp. NPDC049559]|uniref:phosphoribosyltransferase n=1 Tax=Micromonospora sp. NPDC049559 TaxID=3155923 RepID=UPI003424F834
MSTIYQDRTEAGVGVANRLTALIGQPDVIVLGLVRGGVPVAAAVADRLGAPLDVLVVRKLGVPWAPEVAFGALGPGGVQVRTDGPTTLEPEQADEVVHRETAELARRERLYRADRPPLDLTDRTAVIVDDGLATGATARVAVAVARELGAQRVVVAVPVGAEEAYETLVAEADEVVCLQRPAEFGAVSRFYEDFHEVSDDEVTAALAAHR